MRVFVPHDPAAAVDIKHDRQPPLPALRPDDPQFDRPALSERYFEIRHVGLWPRRRAGLRGGQHGAGVLVAQRVERRIVLRFETFDECGSFPGKFRILFHEIPPLNRRVIPSEMLLLHPITKHKSEKMQAVSAAFDGTGLQIGGEAV